MASKKDIMTTQTDDDTEISSSITYASDVIATIAGIAASEVEGIAGMCAAGTNNVLGKNRNVTKGVKVEMGSEEVGIDVYAVVEYGTPIQEAGKNVQENVRKAVEEMTGMRTVRVDVHVQGVSFEKENSALTALQQHVLQSGDTQTDIQKDEAETAPEIEENAEADTETVEDKACDEQ